jgi:protein-S-isoprenylcysteine O-methyltransferase Ste14
MESQSNQQTNNDRADVLLFPPLVGLVLILLGVGLQLVFPANLLAQERLALTVGGLILAFGIGLQIACIRTLKSAKTTPLFKKPTMQILQRGPYAKSRNPIYIAVLLQFSGLALMFNTWWIVAILPVLFLYLHFGVIAGEERYLERKFGDDYRAYMSGVPRWL